MYENTKVFCLFCVFLFNSSAFATCVQLLEYDEASLISYVVHPERTKCIELKGLTPNNTVVFLNQATINGNSSTAVSYRATFTRPDGIRIYDTSVTTSSVDTRLSLNGNSSIKLFLSPEKGVSTHHFVFDVINVKENSGFSIINITVRAIKSSVKPIDPGECSSCPSERMMSRTSRDIKSYSATKSDVSQCTDANRPPKPSPSNKVTGEQLNYNSVFQKAEAQKDSWASKYTLPVAEAAAFWDMYQKHKTAGEYDVKTSASLYDGNADDGNFLYGGRMAAFGFSRDFTVRASASYQGIQDQGLNIVGGSLGFYNFVANTGDNAGDPEMVGRGWDYKTQVQSQNRYDLKSSSCIDAMTKAAIEGSGGSVGSGGDDSDVGTGSDGTSLPGNGGGSGSGTGTVWCLYQKGIMQYCYILNSDW